MDSDITVKILEGLPRSGKTYTGIALLKQSASGCYISQKHETIDGAIKNLIGIEGKIAVKLEGKSRLCKKNDHKCSNCLMFPSDTNKDHITSKEVDELISDVIHTTPIINKEVIKGLETPEKVKKYGGLCPYHILQKASENADFIFTVPQLVPTDGYFETVVIDEDPTMDYYYPNSVCICEYTHLKNNRAVKIEIPELEKLKNIVSNRKPSDPLDLEILELIRIIEQFRTEIGNFKDNKVETDTLLKRLNDIPYPNIKKPSDTLKRIEKYSSDNDVQAIFEPILFPGMKRVYIEKGRYLNKLYLIANEEQIIRDLPKTDKLLIIGSTKGELFAQKISSNIEVKTKPDLPFKKNFCIIPIEMRDQKNKKGYFESNNQIVNLCKQFYQSNVPVVVVTGSKNAQQTLERKMRDFGLSPLCSQQESCEEQIDSLVTGRPNIIYANSNVSRGVDLDLYDVLIMYHSNFSTPYWSS